MAEPAADPLTVAEAAAYGLTPGDVGDWAPGYGVPHERANAVHYREPVFDGRGDNGRHADDY